MPKWSAHVTVSRDHPVDPRRGILHLHSSCLVDGATDVSSAEEFAAFVSAHPEIGFVIVYDSRFPQRAMAWAKFIEKHARKIWRKKELVRAFSEAQRKRMADPNYVPSVADALAHPAEFVEEMKESA